MDADEPISATNLVNPDSEPSSLYMLCFWGGLVVMVVGTFVSGFMFDSSPKTVFKGWVIKAWVTLVLTLLYEIK